MGAVEGDTLLFWSAGHGFTHVMKVIEPATMTSDDTQAELSAIAAIVPPITFDELLGNAALRNWSAVRSNMVGLARHNEAISEKPTEWNALLSMLEARGVDLSLLPPRVPDATAISDDPLIAGFDADGAAGIDRLGIERDVDALASVIVARDVKPPISVGLFGEWGSGKSFFMEKLQERVDELRDEARKAPGGTAFCADVVQIRFNAWHYMDTTLWASLTAHIFDQLGRVVEADVNAREAGAQEARAKARILSAITSERDVLAEAEQQRAAAAEALRVSTEQAEKVRAAQARDPLLLALEASKQPVLKEHLKQAADMLGLSEAKAATDGLQAQLLRARGFVGKLRTTWSALSDFRSWTPYLALLAAVVVVVMINGYLTLDRFDAWIRRFIAVAGALGTVVGWWMRKLNPAFRILEEVDEARKAVTESADRTAAEATKAGEARLKAADEAVAAARAHLAELEKQLVDLGADQQIANFLRDRRSSADYTQHLGVVAKARRDFERLRDLLVKRAELPRALAAKDNPLGIPRIDRIVLYIDDLDRCPESKVVDVLQAVHLLLAFELFVVVVGVDPRWLLHSLEQHSSALRAETEDELDEQKEVWRSTALDYLEKIFQIPFTLNPMGKTGYGDLIGSLVADKSVGKDGDGDMTQPAGSQAASSRANDDVKVIHTGDAGAGSSIATPALGSAPTPALTPALGNTLATAVSTAVTTALAKTSTPPVVQKSGSDSAEAREAAALRRTEYLRISDAESNAMKELHRFIPSPRAAKRFVNVYRLIRASASANDRGLLIDVNGEGDFKVVQLMLAMQIGFPDAAVPVLRALIDGATGSWPQLIARVDKALPNDVEREEWVAMQAAIDSLALPKGTPLSAFVRWAPRVARYSFQSGRVLMSRNAT